MQWKLVGMYNNIRQATVHHAVEMFFKFTFHFPGDTARLRRAFPEIISNCKLKNINGRRNRAMRMIKDTVEESIKPLLGKI